MKHVIINVENLHHINTSKDSIYLVKTEEGINAKLNNGDLLLCIKNKEGFIFTAKKKLPGIKA